MPCPSQPKQELSLGFLKIHVFSSVCTEQPEAGVPREPSVLSEVATAASTRAALPKTAKKCSWNGLEKGQDSEAGGDGWKRF